MIFNNHKRNKKDTLPSSRSSLCDGKISFSKEEHTREHMEKDVREGRRKAWKWMEEKEKKLGIKQR